VWSRVKTTSLCFTFVGFNVKTLKMSKFQHTSYLNGNSPNEFCFDGVISQSKVMKLNNDRIHNVIQRKVRGNQRVIAYGFVAFLKFHIRCLQSLLQVNDVQEIKSDWIQDGQRVFLPLSEIDQERVVFSSEKRLFDLPSWWLFVYLS